MQHNWQVRSHQVHSPVHCRDLNGSHGHLTALSLDYRLSLFPDSWQCSWVFQFQNPGQDQPCLKQQLPCWTPPHLQQPAIPVATHTYTNNSTKGYRPVQVIDAIHLWQPQNIVPRYMTKYIVNLKPTKSFCSYRHHPGPRLDQPQVTAEPPPLAFGGPYQGRWRNKSTNSAGWGVWCRTVWGVCSGIWCEKGSYSMLIFFPVFSLLSRPPGSLGYMYVYEG